MCKFLFEFALILILLPLLLIAIAFLVFGIWGLTSFNSLAHLSVDASSSFDPQSQKALNDLMDFIAPYAIGVCVFFVVIGCFLLIISVLGICGACCDSVCMMATFAALIGVVAVCSLITSIVYLANPSLITDPVLQEMESLILTNFDDMDNPRLAGNSSSIEGRTAAITYLFREMECCGLSNYTDFQASKKWNRRYLYPGNSRWAVNSAVVPVMCCKYKFQYQFTSASKNQSYYWPGDKNSLNTTCIAAPTAENSYIKTSCKEKITGAAPLTALWYSFGISLALLVLFFIAIALTCWYCKKNKDDHEMHEMS